MNEKLQEAINAITQRFEAQSSQFRGETTIIVKHNDIVGVCQLLRDELGFDLLEDQPLWIMAGVSPVFMSFIRYIPIPIHCVYVYASPWIVTHW
jgi:hypothetical protein